MPGQLTERRSGNEHYQHQRFEKALRHYERALSIVELVQGLSSADQVEIDSNRQTVLLNMAAVHLATERHGQAVEYCNRVLATDPTNVKALMRRAKALALRHEYQVNALRQWLPYEPPTRLRSNNDLLGPRVHARVPGMLAWSAARCVQALSWVQHFCFEWHGQCLHDG